MESSGSHTGIPPRPGYAYKYWPWQQLTEPVTKGSPVEVQHSPGTGQTYGWRCRSRSCSGHRESTDLTALLSPHSQSKYGRMSTHDHCQHFFSGEWATDSFFEHNSTKPPNTTKTAWKPGSTRQFKDVIDFTIVLKCESYINVLIKALYTLLEL